MPRIYDARGENGGRVFPKYGCRVLAGNSGGYRREDGEVESFNWGELAKVRRIEFDDDADEGPATVTVFIQATDGRMVREPDFKALATATFRCMCKLECLNPAVAADAPCVVQG